MRLLSLSLMFTALLAVSFAQADTDPKAARKNGFLLTPSSVPSQEILAGGPPRDGIPALDEPAWLAASAAPWHEDEIVVGVVRGEEARAYPIAILNWHELVNDTLGGDAILVSYCPLCGTALVFDRTIGGRARSFGVSGLLYQSDLLLYDRQTESLWSQIQSEAVTGEAKGLRLKVLRSALLPWGEWKNRHPNTGVLSLDTGHSRPYSRDPYQGYATSEELLFPAPLDQRYHPKMPTLGVRLAPGAARAYPALELERAGGAVQEAFEGREIQVSYDVERQIFDVEAPFDIEVIEGYWFAWSAFHPGTTVFVAAPSATPEAKIHRYRLADSGTQWHIAGTDAVLEDLRGRYPEFFATILNPEATEEPNLKRLRDDLEHTPVDRRNYDALNSVAIAYFELNSRAENDRGGSRYLSDSFLAAKVVAVPWRAYGETQSGALRDAILDFFDDAATGQKERSARTASRLTRVVSSLEKKEIEPGRKERIQTIAASLKAQVPAADPVD